MAQSSKENVILTERQSGESLLQMMKLKANHNGAQLTTKSSTAVYKNIITFAFQFPADIWIQAV